MTLAAVMCCRKNGACRICLPQWFFSSMISWQRLWLPSRCRTQYNGCSISCISPFEPSCSVSKELHWQTVWAITYKSSECRGRTLIFIIDFLQTWPIRWKVSIPQFSMTPLLYQVRIYVCYINVSQPMYCDILNSNRFCTFPFKALRVGSSSHLFYHSLGLHCCSSDASLLQQNLSILLYFSILITLAWRSM